MKKILIILFLISSIVACKSQPKEILRKVDVVTFKEELAHKKNIQLVDVRTPEEYQEGYIENAILIDYFSEDFNTKIQELDKEKPVYLYCRSGNRSGKASILLLDFGFTEIVDLEGGYEAWSEQ
ncbi:MAG: rhodanese-like domain-containing protein [Bacteroidetes bacterium]|nr:MAG: rhodanese-like domain-containing protein [Bacteroidota bacterium]